MSTRASADRLRKTAGVLAILFGLVGAFAGVSGAATFVGYHEQNRQSLVTGEALAVISGIGALISVAGVVAGYWLYHGRANTSRLAFGTAVGSMLTVAAFALSMPGDTPSPVPGGLGAFVLLAVAVLAYGAEVLLLLIGAMDDPAIPGAPPASA